MLSMKSGDRKREVEVAARDYAPVAEEYRAYFMPESEDIFCFRGIGAVPRADWVAPRKDALGVTGVDAEKT